MSEFAKNPKLWYGIMLMGVGIAMNAITSLAIGTVLLGLGALFFISGMNQMKKNKKEEDAK